MITTKMKKGTAILLSLVLILSLAGCGNSTASVKTPGQSSSVQSVLDAEIAKEDSKKDGAGEASAEADPVAGESRDDYPDPLKDLPATEEEGEGYWVGDGRQSGVDENAPEPEDIGDENPAGADGIDVDLTTLSANMVYSEVYNMMVSPDDFIGKTIKMDGVFAYYWDEATDNEYFSCIISDATACCSKGIEFILSGNKVYPDDYPLLGEEICVVGVFDTYQEGEYTYCTLRNAELI